MLDLATFVPQCLEEHRRGLENRATETARKAYMKMTEKKSYLNDDVSTEIDGEYKDLKVLKFIITGLTGEDNVIWQSKFEKEIQKCLPDNLEVVGVGTRVDCRELTISVRVKEFANIRTIN